MKTVIQNARILTMDQNNTYYEEGYVVTDNGIITDVGPGSCPHDHIGPDTELVDAKGWILMPGMINTHCHVSMIPFRTMGDDCKDRLRRFLFPLEEKAMTPDLVYWGALYGIAEMLLSGITTFLDMYYFEDKVAEAADLAGIRAYLGETVIGQKTCDSEEPYGGIEYAEQFIKDWNGRTPLVSALIAPHATNTCNAEALARSYGIAEKYDTLFTLHNAEMDYEMEYFSDELGTTPTAFLESLGILSPRTVLAHCIHMTDNDLDLVARCGSKVAHCIGSNTKSGKGVAPVKEMLDHGITVGLGTDGASSGNTLSMFTQFRLFASCHKTANHDRSVFTADEIVKLGTIEGAKVLGAEDITGSIETGKQADLVLVETDSVNMFPSYNPYSALVYSAERTNVDSVWVAGKKLVSGGKLTGLDLEEIKGALIGNMGDFLESAEEYSSII